MGGMERLDVEHEKGTAVIWCFLNVMVHKNRLDSWLKHRFLGQRICISNEATCDTKAAGPGITLLRTITVLPTVLILSKTKAVWAMEFEWTEISIWIKLMSKEERQILTKEHKSQQRGRK